MPIDSDPRPAGYGQGRFDYRPDARPLRVRRRARRHRARGRARLRRDEALRRLVECRGPEPSTSLSSYHNALICLRHSWKSAARWLFRGTGHRRASSLVCQADTCRERAKLTMFGLPVLGVLSNLANALTDTPPCFLVTGRLHDRASVRRQATMHAGKAACGQDPSDPESGVCAGFRA